MYVGLIVRDECERSVKNQVSKVELVDFATSSREATREKDTCGAHDWKMKSRAKLSNSQVLCKKGHLARYLQNSLFDEKKKCFTLFFTHTIYIFITHKM